MFSKHLIRLYTLLHGELMVRQHVVIQESPQVAADACVAVPKPLDQLSKSEIERKLCTSRVMTLVLRHLTLEFVNRRFEWLLPVVFSKSTDPLRPDPGASIEKRIEVEIYGTTVRPTLSMIVHKMVACSLAHPRLFILSPNVRIERAHRADTGRHAYEFTQLDFEVRDDTSKSIRRFMEEIICSLIRTVKKRMPEELTQTGRLRNLAIPKAPFHVYDRQELEKRYGNNWENWIMSVINAPVWVTNIPREFYDFQDFESGKWDNYDLILPNYGEVLSGSKREWKYDKIVKKLERDGVRKENYRTLLNLAKEGKLKPSAGAGIGVERLVSWIAGAKHIGETQLFPKIPGLVYDL